MWLAFLFTLTGLVCFALSLRNVCDVENLIKVFFFKVLSYGKHISISDETSLSLVFVPFCTATVSLNFLLMLRLCLTFHMFEWGGQSVGTDTWLELLSLTRGQFAKVFVLVHPF